MSEASLGWDYKDEAAEQLYIDAGSSKLVGAHARISNALKNQGVKLEEFYNTPYTDQSAKTLHASTAALVVIGDELRKWHELIYPNRPKP